MVLVDNLYFICWNV